MSGWIVVRTSMVSASAGQRLVDWSTQVSVASMTFPMTLMS